MIACDPSVLSATASAGDRGAVPGSALFLGPILALRRP